MSYKPCLLEELVDFGVNLVRAVCHRRHCHIIILIYVYPDSIHLTQYVVWVCYPQICHKMWSIISLFKYTPHDPSLYIWYSHAPHTTFLLKTPNYSAAPKCASLMLNACSFVYVGHRHCQWDIMLWCNMGVINLGGCKQFFVRRYVISTIKDLVTTFAHLSQHTVTASLTRDFCCLMLLILLIGFEGRTPMLHHGYQYGYKCSNNWCRYILYFQTRWQY